MIGPAVLSSGFLAFIDCSRGHGPWQPRQLSWWVVVVNLLGCLAFCYRRYSPVLTAGAVSSRSRLRPGLRSSRRRGFLVGFASLRPRQRIQVSGARCACRFRSAKSWCYPPFNYNHNDVHLAASGLNYTGITRQHEEKRTSDELFCDWRYRFIGRFVVERLLKRPSVKGVYSGAQSKQKFEALRDSLGADPARLLPMWGDITTPGLVSKANLAKLKGKIDHVYHLAAVYDLNMSDEQGDRVNNEGTRNVVEFANALGGKVSLQHMSSIAIAGGHFKGVFKESMFDEGQDTSHPYYRTKFQSERIVRKECKVPWRVYRPGQWSVPALPGKWTRSTGPITCFPTIKAIVDTVPKWLPLLGVEGGKIPIVPVDYVADATVAIAHKPGLDGKAFQLLQAPQDSTGKIMEIFFDAAHGPGLPNSSSYPACRSW